MKLHLPKKFKTALMAAFATVSCTTVSTASLGAAVFAFAGYQAAAEETASTEESAADKAGQEEIRDNIRILQEKQDEEDESEFTVDPADQGIMERRAKNLERAGDGAASSLAKEAYEQMEAEIFNPEAATTAAPAQQQTSTGSGELPSDDLGFTSNPYATTSTGNSEPVFEVTPATAATTDFLQETSSEQESTGSSSGSSTPASASGFGSSAGGGSADGGYSPFGLALGSIAPVSVGETGSLVSAPLLGDAAIEDTSTYLTWRGNEHEKYVWQNGGDAKESPWDTYDSGGGGVQTAFTNGDIALFEYSAEVTVSGDVQTGSLQLNKGTSAEQMLVVTINTGAGAKLTADHVVTIDLFEQKSFYNKIVKKGTGEIDFTIDDPSFDTILDIQQGTANITFKNGDTFNLYENILGSTSSTVTLNFENDFKTEGHVKFNGIDAYNVAAGKTLQLDMAPDSGEFCLNKANTTINLGDLAILNNLYEAVVDTKHLTITGKGDALFQGVIWMNHGEGTAVHDIKNGARMLVNGTDSYDGMAVTGESTVMRIDDDSSLYVHTLYMTYSTQPEYSFYHAYESTGDMRQSTQIDNLGIGPQPVRMGSAYEKDSTAGYQQGGDFIIDYLYTTTAGGTSKLILENNLTADDNNQGLTDVFYIGEYMLGESDYSFGGIIQLAANGDGLAENHKQVALILRDRNTTGWSHIEIDDNAKYTNFGIGIDNDTVEVNGIHDVQPLQEGSSVKIFSGSVSGELNPEFNSDDTLRTLIICNNSGNYDNTAAGVDKNLDIVKYGGGTQTFTGDFSNFDQDITVQASKLEILNNETVTAKEVTIYDGAQLSVQQGIEQIQQDGLLVVSDLLMAKGTTVETASKLDGNLEMKANSVYDVSAAGGVGGLNLTGELTITKGEVSLSEDDWAAVGELGWFGMYDLAFGVTDVLGLGEDIDWSVGVDATEVFANEGLRANEYYVRYSQGTAGGNGNNVGTVYIYRIPEPTTGTLSLLALAALAARRRRK